MYVGTQIEPRDDSDYRVWAQLGVTHVCVDPPGSPHYWSLDTLRRHKDHVESFGLSLDMVQLPIPSGPVTAQDRPYVAPKSATTRVSGVGMAAPSMNASRKRAMFSREQSKSAGAVERPNPGRSGAKQW